MKKDDEDKLVNAIIDLHGEIKLLRKDMGDQLGKVNLGIGELRLSYMKLDESVNKMRSDFNQMRTDLNKLDSSFNKYARSTDALLQNHELRISHLEDTQNTSSAREPKTSYTKKKKK